MTGTDGLVDAVDRLCSATSSAAPQAAFDKSAWDSLEQAGFTLVPIPERLGGSGGTLSQAADVLRAASRHAIGVPLAETMWLAGWLLAASDVPVPAGPLTATVAGDDVTLTRAADGWRLDGTLRRVPWARHAAEIVVLATAGDGPVVVRVGGGRAELHLGHNLAGEPRDDVLLDGVRVAGDDVVPAGAGVSAEMFRSHAALARVVALSGAAEQVLNLCLRYAGERVQFGRPLIAFQAVQQLVAQLAGEVAALVVSGQAASTKLAEDAAHCVWAAKAAAAESAGVVAAIGHQIHGAMGMTIEHPLYRSTTRLWSWREEYGNEQAHYQALGRLVAATDPWELITGLDRR
jgi:acyl-CoA dehydrogenase